jgi:hypothetical protein
LEQDTSSSSYKEQRRNGDPPERTSDSFDVLSNLRDAPDYHPSKMNRNLRHGSGIIHPNYNSNDQMSYTITVIVSGDVQTEEREC